MSEMVKVSVNTSHLEAAQRLFQQHSRNTMAENLNRTAHFIALAAQRMTPFVTISRIDTELNAVSTPILSKKGKRAGLPLKSGKQNVAVVEGGLATKIILARMKRGSYYNRITDHKYYIDRATFSPGGGVKGFWKKVESAAVRMVKARHSSIKFFAASWNVIMDKLKPVMPAGYRGGSRTTNRVPVAEMAEVSVAKPGNAMAIVTCENLIGNSGKFPQLDYSRSSFARRVMVPILQRAIDQEFESKMIAAEKRGWLKLAPKLKAHGVTLDV